jgi:NADPH:quinone reductase
VRAVICNAFEGPDSLVTGDVPAPRPGRGEILVEVHAASISFMDCLLVSGKYQMRPATPFVPGTDAAGIVAALGQGVTRFRVGDRVACGNWFGAYGDQMVVPHHWAAHLPDNIDFVTGSAVRHGYGTAYYALVVRAHLTPGEWLFVTGAAGGVGLAVVDLARHLGARVIAGVGSPDKVDLVRKYGASEVIEYDREDLRERIKAITAGKGVDVFFDNLGGDVFGTMTRLMNWGGRILPMGFTTGDIPLVPVNLLLLKNYSIVGAFWGAWAQRDPAASAAADKQLFDWIAQGKLHPHVGQTLPLNEFKEGMRLVTNRLAQGRVVLKLR